MIKILFVCHGNICRSPMAEYIMKDLVTRAGRGGEFEIASAAVSREELGSDVYPPARRELQKHGIPCGHRASRLMREADFLHYDHIYYMDRRNAQYLARLFPGKWTVCKSLLPHDVADPWYTGDFSETWEDIFTGCTRILEELA